MRSNLIPRPGWREFVTGARTAARIAWAVLKPLGELAGIAVVVAIGVVSIWHTGGELLGNDAGIMRHIAHDMAFAPGGKAAGAAAEMFMERFVALVIYTLGWVSLLAGGASVIEWFGKVRGSLFARKNNAAAS